MDVWSYHSLTVDVYEKGRRSAQHNLMKPRTTHLISEPTGPPSHFPMYLKIKALHLIGDHIHEVETMRPVESWTNKDITIPLGFFRYGSLTVLSALSSPSVFAVAYISKGQSWKPAASFFFFLNSPTPPFVWRYGRVC